MFSESTKVFFMATYTGSVPPTQLELINQVSNSTNRFLSIFGYNTSFIAPVSKNYIYYDVYAYLSGLEEQTDYEFFFLSEDLSHNVGDVKVISFTTDKKHFPVKFKIVLKENISSSKLLNALALVTSLPKERFAIMSQPLKFSIPLADESIVKNIL